MAYIDLIEKYNQKYSTENNNENENVINSIFVARQPLLDCSSFCFFFFWMTFSAVFDTGLHADCVQFIPKVEEELAVFSCYELDETVNKRVGRLILAERVGDAVETVQVVDDLPGVFEFTWFPGTQILVTALSDGPPQLFTYENEEKRLVPLTINFDSANEPINMTLALAGTAASFLSCDNRGILREWSVETSQLTINSQWQAHDAEIWYVAQDLREESVFFTGSDDFLMKMWDLRAGFSPVLTNRGHEAGVCCIAPSPWDEFVVATGSYDEKMRLWDRRRMKEPLKAVECGSGVWRVKWNPQKSNVMGVAAMRAGFHVLDLAEEESPIVRTELVDDHVAYGIDWHPNGSSLASCSFYNNQGQFFM